MPDYAALAAEQRRLGYTHRAKMYEGMAGALPIDWSRAEITLAKGTSPRASAKPLPSFELCAECGRLLADHGAICRHCGPTRDQVIEELKYTDYRHGSETGFESSKAIPHFIDALIARGWLEVRDR